MLVVLKKCIYFLWKFFTLYGTFTDIGTLDMGCLVMGSLVMGSLVMGSLVMGSLVMRSLVMGSLVMGSLMMGRFVCESLQHLNSHGQTRYFVV